MTRFLYVCLLRLHPRRFRLRYAEEMLWIFDQTAGSRAVTRLFADALISLLRQWALRRDFWQQPATSAIPRPVSDRVPLFYTSESSMPSSSALVNGAVLSIAAFGILAFLIAHGGPSGPVTLPRVVVQPPEIMGNFVAEMPRSARNQDSPLGGSFRPSDVTQRDSNLVRRKRGKSNSYHRGAAPREPFEKSLPLIEYPGSKANAGETHLDMVTSEAVQLISLLDNNSDGKISKNERSNASSLPLRKFLDSADLNGDGFVTLEELLDKLSSDRHRPLRQGQAPPPTRQK